jgi:glucose-1-phosphate thymidylyltransferase
MIKNAKPEDCIGLIPAAGKGKRLNIPFPKELFPIVFDDKYQPVAQFSVESIKSAGIKHIVFVVNETKHAVVGYFGSGIKFECNFSYVVQEGWPIDLEAKSPGLAHALDSAFHLIKDRIVFFSMADTVIFPKNVFAQAKQNSPRNADLLLCLFPTKTPEKYGMVDFLENKKVISIIDKPERTNLTYMWGCIIWTPKFSNFLHNSVTDGAGDFAEIMNNSIMAGINAYGYTFDDSEYFDIGTHNAILNVFKFLNR